jgi:uncharacterized protein
MPAPRSAAPALEERIRAELELIRSNVSGVYGSLVATSDGFLVTHDVPDLEPTEIAALVATTRALATRTTAATGRGEFREAMAKGSKGYLAAYAAGSNAIVAVIGTTELNVGLLQLQTREIVARIAEQSAEIGRWMSGSSGGQAGGRRAEPGRADAGPPGPPPPLPQRRPAAPQR